VTYSGTVGNAHGLDSMLGVSKLLRQDQPDVMILIVGSGAEEETLRSHFVEYQAHNLQLLGQKPRAELPAILAGSDIGLAVLKPSPIFRTVVPTKIYEYMATGLPVLTNVAGETENIIAESGAGIAVPNGDDIALAKQIAKLRENPDALKSMSVAGIKYSRESASWVTRAEQYEEVLEKTVRN
jgi:colanic acid biosynthesis glycosyl transferase WcaI